MREAFGLLSLATFTEVYVLHFPKMKISFFFVAT
jgi:hypothetical protein